MSCLSPTKIAWLIMYTMIIVSISVTLYTKSACIIVHGTWASDTAWYRHSGDFYESVLACNQELQLVDEIIPFTWSGKLGHPAQLQAGQELAQIITTYDLVILIGHSHGVTVGIIASQLLQNDCTNGNNFNKVDTFYALGVPVDEMNLMPNMNVIQTFYNLFSFGDNVQTVNGNYKRVYSSHERIVNLSIQINDQHPEHHQLHHPIIGRHLLKIDQFFVQKEIGNFQNFSFDHPGMIFFYDYQNPQYMTQPDQERLLRIDEQALTWTTYAFFRNEKNDNESS